jgi:hypothetical protein
MMVQKTVGRLMVHADRPRQSLAICMKRGGLKTKKNGINDYGRRGEMKDFAVRAVVEDFFAWMFATPKFAWRLEPARDSESFIERVRLLMEKAAWRRDLSVDWILEELDILASDEGLVIELPPQVARK